jgi:anaerobic magnesium-protoporphyrin IX monomethyl ester cyclase
MKISLINPPWNSQYPQPPLGLASLAAVLEKKGFSSEIIDSNALQLSTDNIVKKIIHSDIIAITAMTPSINIVITLVKKIRESNADAKIVLGGPHPTILPVDTLKKCADIDIIVKGEGEVTISDIADAIENDRPIKNINGIAYRSNDYIQDNPPREMIQDLDSLPFLAYHLLPLKKYKFHPPHGRKSPHMAMLTSRGCPYHCTFCSKSVFGGVPRYQSAKRVVSEIEYLYEHFAVKEVALYDDTFTLKKERVYEFIHELKERNLDIAWTCEARVNLVTPDLLDVMKKSGCYMVSYGIESGNQQILNSLNKSITIQQIEKAIAATHRSGIESVGYFMIGSPGESPDTIQETIEFAKKLPLDYAQFSIATPFPGTDFYNDYIKFHQNNDNWDDFIYANLKTGNQPIFETEHLSKNDLKQLNVQAYKEFYMRLSYLSNRLRKIHTISDIKNVFNGVEMFINMIRG